MPATMCGGIVAGVECHITAAVALRGKGGVIGPACATCAAEARRIARIYHAVRLGNTTVREADLAVVPLG